MATKFRSRIRKATALIALGAGTVAGFQNCSASDDWKRQLSISQLTSSSFGPPPLPSPGVTPNPTPNPSPGVTPSPTPNPSPGVTPSPTPNPSPTGSGTIELISDPLLKTGFQEQDACPSVYVATCGPTAQRNVPNGLYPASAGQAPKWTLQQWGSRTSLYGGGGYPYGDGLIWSIGEKHIALFPNGVVQMGVNGFEDWLGQYRQAQPTRLAWPSFTLGYQNSNLGNPSLTPGGTVDKMKSIEMSLDARLVKSDPHQQAGYDRNQNAVVFHAFISVQNLTAGSAGYGQYIMLMMPIYYDLDPLPPSYDAADSYGEGLGLGMLIFSPGYTYYAQTSLQSLQWVHLGADVLPKVKAGVNSALNKALLKDADLSHYYVAGYSVSFEVTGLNETTVQFKNMSIKVTR